MQDFLIQNRKIGPSAPPFIIAEMSGNHNHSLERALAIVDAAAAAGAHALKLQTYTADSMTIDCEEGDFVITDPKSLWHGRTLYDLYREAHTPWEWHKPIMDRCRKHNLICFSTPFDVTSLNFLEELNVPCYKIASFENTDIPLIKKVAATGKPMIISTGMANISELAETVEAARSSGCKDLVLLKCTSSYPASPADSNLRTIPHMRDLFDVQVGLSDHTLGIGVPLASIAFGATVIEKHFTLRRKDGGVDSAFSIEPNELADLVQNSERAWQALGQVDYGKKGSDKKSKQFRRSIYLIEDCREGDTLTEDNIRTIRPGGGMPPKYFEKVLGRKLRCSAKKGTPLSPDILV